MDIYTSHLRISSLCFVLFSIVQQHAMAVTVHAVSSDAYYLPVDAIPADPQPPFKPQSQESPGLESKMEPRPDFGYTSYKGSGKLQGKVAIITGGDSGIGRAVALAFAREGASVVISYLNGLEDAQEIQQIIQQEGHECLLIRANITEETQCKKIIDTTVARFKRIDILINNAAYQGKALNESIEGMGHDRVLYTFRTNIIAMFDLTRYAIPYIPKGGSIINVGSTEAYQPSAEILDYATTKAAIVAFTKGLASKMVEKGIRVNCIAPASVWTPLVVSSWTADAIVEFGADNPMKRPAQPRELAPAFVFLASNEASSFISGETLTIAGGKIAM